LISPIILESFLTCPALEVPLTTYVTAGMVLRQEVPLTTYVTAGMVLRQEVPLTTYVTAGMVLRHETPSNLTK
jgi:hypothetical protein